MQNGLGHFQTERRLSSRFYSNNGYSPISSSDDQQSCSYQDQGSSDHSHLRHQPSTSTSHLQSQHHRYGGAGVEVFSRHNTMASSLTAIGDSMSEIVIDDLQNENEPTSAILDYCKRKFLRPYVTILNIVGLHPMNSDATPCRSCFSHIQALIVICILCFGYFLQYLSSFRGDRGFTANYEDYSESLTSKSSSHHSVYKTLGETIFVYVIPNCLHLMGFISAVIVYKIADNEHLQNLVERVFLMSTRPKRLCFVLWMYVLAGLVWLGLLLAYVLLLASTRDDIIQSRLLGTPNDDWQYAAKILLVASVFIHDTIQIVILMTYSIECLLLRIHLIALSEKLILHTIENLDWMREMLEFRKLLMHLNNRVSLPVCFFTIMNLSYSFAGLIFLFKDFDFADASTKLIVLNISNVIMWLSMGLMPFFQAAALTRVCARARANGHQVRVRPFVYHHSTLEDLNSTLLFASSLDMSAKLFRIPIQVNYLSFAVLVIAVGILTLGMCLNFSLGVF